MTAAITDGACLNCGAELTGKFCAQCGQRAIPPYPTVRETLRDAWEEFSGWDGRLAATAVSLARRPGALTVDALEGRRARYVKPLRVYLAASLLYFLLASLTPNLRPQQVAMPGGVVKIDLGRTEGAAGWTREEREQMAKGLERAPWWAKTLLEPVVEDPVGFRRRMAERVPHTFFVLVPVFAALLAAFYWRRRYMQHLTFSLHLHAVVFFGLAFVEAMKFTYLLPLVVLLQLLLWISVLVYTAIALRRVYGGGRVATVAKLAGLASVYLTVMGVAIAATYVLTALID